MTRPLSAIIKEMAFTILRRPEAPPSSEAAHAALLLAHSAWNRRNDTQTPDYRAMIGEFEASNPNLWDELKSTDPDELIAELAAYRERNHRDDQRYYISLSAACVARACTRNGFDGSARCVPAVMR